MKVLEGTVNVKLTTRGYVMTGFTDNDYIRLRWLARKYYKLQTKRRRTLKKYVKLLLHEALVSRLNII